MTAAVLVALAAGALLGFAVGLCVGRSKRRTLAFVGDFLGEEVEAVHGADLDADVAAERALRLPQRQPIVELYDQDADYPEGFAPAELLGAIHEPTPHGDPLTEARSRVYACRCADLGTLLCPIHNTVMADD